MLLLLTAGLAILYLGAESLVRGATSLALRLGITPLVVGLTVVAFGTSSPELVVSMNGALRGFGDLAVGNVVGSNICNIALILGLSALVRPIQVETRIVRVHIPLLLVVSMALSLILLDHRLGRLEGAVLVAAFLIYTGAVIRLSHAEPHVVRTEFHGGMPDDRGKAASLILVFAGLAALIVGSILVVKGAVGIARLLGVGELLIGLTVVAVGTSLPELATSVVASARNQGDIAVGNVVGSNIFNITAILGVVALGRPVASDIPLRDLGVMVLVTVVLLPLARTGFRVTRLEGGILLAMYGGYVCWLVR